MSFFIKLTQRTKRILSIDIQIQQVSPKVKLMRSRAFTFNKNNLKKNSDTVFTNSNQKSHKIVLKPLYNYPKDQAFQDLKFTKCTPKKQFKIQPIVDFSVSGFEIIDVEIEDLCLQSYVRKQ